jgi:RimJ/RimL family protein N-acetyltransferase
LWFREWCAEDLPLARALWGDTRVTARIGGPFSEDQIAARLSREIALHEAHGIQYWPIFLSEGGAHVGCCGLRPRDAAARIFELGFHLRPEHWGKGLSTEAARSAIRFAFEVLDASALFAGHHPENADSRRVLERLGFKWTHDEHYAPTGRMHPSYVLTR